ncbi:MAG: alcohol dehydrogenase catalytic domain-containing protein [Pseudomonadota bacterium]
MQAVMLREGCALGLGEVAEPRLQAPDDVIVRVTTSAICGSDIHIKHGMMPGFSPGVVMGHEFVGVVEEVGPAVRRVSLGQRVSVPAAIWCGTCPTCRQGAFQYCPHGGVWGGGDVFGKGLQGAQTALVRVPFADPCLVPIPDSVPDEQAVFVGDVFATGFHGASQGGIRPGDTVAVFGCGPIGLAAVISAQLFGPSRVIAMDMLANRLELARRFGAETVDVSQADPVALLREATGGEGVDVAIEAIGSPDALLMALGAVRRGGMVSVVGLFPGPIEFPIQQMAYYGVRLAMGLGDVSTMPRLMRLLESGRVDLSPLVTHTFPLAQALEAYELFEHHKDQCLKVLLKP